MLGLLKAEEQGFLKGELEAMAQRTAFSKFLPYLAWDAEHDVYYNSDETLGYLWECSPIAFMTPRIADALVSLVRQDFPQGTVLQFILYPDDHIDPILERYVALKTRPDPLVPLAARHYAEHLSKGRDGFKSISGIPARNFRVFVAIKSPEPLKNEQIAALTENLTQARLRPRPLRPPALLAWLRRFFNPGNVPANAEAYDENQYLRNQVILSETKIEDLDDEGVRIGGLYGACLTPKTPPAGIDELDMNRLIGGFDGPSDDTTQILQRFMWTTTIVFEASESKVKRKADIMMAQRAGGSIAKVLGRRVGELNWVLDDLEQTPYCNVLTSMWVFGRSEQERDDGLARARGLWEKQKFVVQRETAISVPMLIASLPFGLYALGSNIATIDRDLPMSVDAAVKLLPVQADFSGGMAPVLLFVGRKGQLAGIDVFDKGANGHNFLTAAETGAGKSFFTNFVLQNYYATGALMRVVDVGRSYEKQALSAKGRFIDIGGREKVVLNPFASVARDAEDRAADEATTAELIMTMIYSASGTANVTETERTLVKSAVRFAYARDGGEFGINHVAEFLRGYPGTAEAANIEVLPSLEDEAHRMGFNLLDFTSKGRYGAIFNGKSTFNIASDQFVVLELDRIFSNKELFTVVALQVLNAITQDLYLSDRSQRRFMLFDEAWKYLEPSSTGAAGMIAGVILEGYRRARKYGGATGIVTQSPLDLQKFGPAGEIIKGNSAFKFWLQSSDYTEAAKRNVIDYEGLVLDLARGIKSVKPHYSEVLFDTPFGVGVGRLCVDPWTYALNASDKEAFEQFEAGMRRFDGDAVRVVSWMAAGAPT